MTHYLFFLRALPGQAETLADWFLHTAGPKIAASSDCTGLCVNIAVDAPGDKPLYRNEATAGDRFDVTLDLSCPDEAAFDRLMVDWMAEIDARTEANFGYDVEYLVEKDSQQRTVGNPVPGYKIIRGFHFVDVLSPQAARHCWDNRVALALKVHGFDKYVRYWVNRAVTPDAPAIGGATNLQFGSADAVLNGYFRVADGMEQIQHDVGHFIDRGLERVFTREHVLK